jgi:RsiW-degrading membrane proteinase PrsW (M82 family)
MRINRDRQSLWRTEIAQIVGLLLYVGIVELIVLVTDPSLSGWPLVLVSVLLAVIPAVLWMSLFYAQDRVEPEPRHYVLGVALLGALLAAAVGQPLLDGFFGVSDWIGRDTLTEILGSILVIGFTQEFLKYAAVRFSVFYSNEFDQRIDGVIYGSAAGLGYAAMLNIGMVLSGGGVDLGVGVILIVVTQMLHGSLGALVGYFLGRDRFDPRRVWWIPLGLLVAATLDGLFSWFSGEVTRSAVRITGAGVAAGGYNPWPALILGTAFAAVVLAAVFVLIRQDNRNQDPSPPAPLPQGERGVSVP